MMAIAEDDDAVWGEADSNYFGLLAEEIAALEEAQEEAEWLEYYQLLKEYRLEHGHCSPSRGVVYRGKNLGAWVDNQRRRYLPKKASEEIAAQEEARRQRRTAKPNEIGFDCSEPDQKRPRENSEGQQRPSKKPRETMVEPTNFFSSVLTSVRDATNNLTGTFQSLYSAMIPINQTTSVPPAPPATEKTIVDPSTIKSDDELKASTIKSDEELKAFVLTLSFYRQSVRDKICYTTHNANLWDDLKVHLPKLMYEAGMDKLLPNVKYVDPAKAEAD